MKLITSFEESFHSTDRPPNTATQDYEQIIPALKHGLEVAGSAFGFEVADTVFSRGAKKELKQAMIELVGGFSIRPGADCLNLLPFWVQEVSVTVDIGKTTLGPVLSELVQSLATLINNQLQGKPLALVDPLQTHLTQIGPEVFQFRLKQKWTVGVEKRT